MSRHAPGLSPAPRVLVAEGHPHVARLIRDTLLLAGYSVELYSDGGDILRNYRPGSCSLLILDQLVPGTSGLEILGAIRDRGDTVPILLLAGRSRWTDRLRFQVILYQVDMLRKPFGAGELRSAVQRLTFRGGT